MRYVGGKARIAGWVEDSLSPLTGRCGRYLEPFMGGGATLARMAQHFEFVEAGDAHEDLVLMWQAAVSGWVPPEHVSREQYDALKRDDPSAMRGFAGYGASFSGKWFGGYVDQAWDAYHDRMTKPYARAASRSVVRDAGKFAHAAIRHRGFDEWEPREGTLVYCDPPYAGVTGYSALKGSFDHDHFWRTARNWVESGAVVAVSEHAAPGDEWVILAERTRSHMLRATKGGAQEARVERIFIHQSSV